MLQFFRKVWQRLWGRLRYCGAVHYLAGGPSLPPPLTPEQEKALLDRMAAGDAAAREELITHNLRLVVYLAKKYENSGVPAEDLVSIGTIGLIKAVNTFTPARSIKLATYASRCIGNEILMYLRKSSNRRQEASIDEPLNIDGDGNELLLFGLLLLIYTYVPGGRRTPRSQLPGTIFATAGWLVFSRVFSFYILHFWRLSYIYGSLTAVILIILWLYVIINLLFIGAGINAEMNGKTEQ